MARAAKLKVYRTPIGFHDAYVAAPSQKAALAAWGSDADLFARGIADVETEEALTAEPLAKPGEVIRRLRGTAAEQIAEASKVPPAPPKSKSSAKTKSGASKTSKATVDPKRARKPRPRPDRARLDAAEAAVESAQAASRAEDKRISDQIEALTRERADRRAQAEREMLRLEGVCATAEAAYKRAMAHWQDD